MTSQEKLLLALQFVLEHVLTMQQQVRRGGRISLGSLYGAQGSLRHVAEGAGEDGASTAGITCGCSGPNMPFTRPVPGCPRCGGEGTVPMRHIRADADIGEEGPMPRVPGQLRAVARYEGHSYVLTWTPLPAGAPAVVQCYRVESTGGLSLVGQGRWGQRGLDGPTSPPMDCLVRWESLASSPLDTEEHRQELFDVFTSALRDAGAP